MKAKQKMRSSDRYLHSDERAKQAAYDAGVRKGAQNKQNEILQSRWDAEGGEGRESVNYYVNGGEREQPKYISRSEMAENAARRAETAKRWDVSGLGHRHLQEPYANFSGQPLDEQLAEQAFWEQRLPGQVRRRRLEPLPWEKEDAMPPLERADVGSKVNRAYSPIVPGHGGPTAEQLELAHAERMKQLDPPTPTRKLGKPFSTLEGQEFSDWIGPAVEGELPMQPTDEAAHTISPSWVNQSRMHPYKYLPAQPPIDYAFEPDAIPGDPMVGLDSDVRSKEKIQSLKAQNKLLTAAMLQQGSEEGWNAPLTDAERSELDYALRNHDWSKASPRTQYVYAKGLPTPEDELRSRVGQLDYQLTDEDDNTLTAMGVQGKVDPNRKTREEIARIEDELYNEHDRVLNEMSFQGPVRPFRRDPRGVMLERSAELADLDNPYRE